MFTRQKKEGKKKKQRRKKAKKTKPSQIATSLEPILKRNSESAMDQRRITKKNKKE